jgi:hypothetical protein
MSKNVNIMLVHGAWADGSCWNKVTLLLKAKDQMIPPPAQQFLAKRMNATVRTVAASHAAFMARSQEVADIIALAAESV